MNAIVRQLQIDILTDTPNEIIEWFDYQWHNINIIQINVFHTTGGEYIYYRRTLRSLEMIFYRDNTEKFYCSSTLMWDRIMNRYDITGDQTQEVLRILLSNKLKDHPNMIVLPLEMSSANFIQNVLKNII